MREKWTDERMDDLCQRLDRGFDRVDRELRTQRTETRAEFAAIRGEMKGEFAAVRGEMNVRFDALQRTGIQLFVGTLAALVGLIGAQTALLVALL